MNKTNFLYIRTFLLFIVLVLFSSSCGNKNDNSTSTQNSGIAGSEIKSETSGTTIGAFILGSSPLKESFEQGAQLINDTVFKLKFYDVAQGNTPESSTLKSLLEKDKAPVVIYWSADDISPVAQLISSSNSVGIVAVEVSEKVIPLGANIYGFGYSNELTFGRLAKFAGNTLKSYRFAVIAANESHYDEQSKVFIEETKSLGNTIVFEEKVTANISDFSSIIARAGKENCDTIFAVLPTQSLISFIKALRTAQYKGKVIVGDTLFAADITSLGQDAEGIYMTQAWSDDANLKSIYSAKYGSIPDPITLGFIALGYDTAKCLQGIGGQLDAYNIKSSLLSAPCEGITGKTQFTGERMAQRRKVILTVKGGQSVKAE